MVPFPEEDPFTSASLILGHDVVSITTWMHHHGHAVRRVHLTDPKCHTVGNDGASPFASTNGNAGYFV